MLALVVSMSPALVLQRAPLVAVMPRSSTTMKMPSLGQPAMAAMLAVALTFAPMDAVHAASKGGRVTTNRAAPKPAPVTSSSAAPMTGGRVGGRVCRLALEPLGAELALALLSRDMICSRVSSSGRGRRLHPSPSRRRRRRR